MIRGLTQVLIMRLSHNDKKLPCNDQYMKIFSLKGTEEEKNLACSGTPPFKYLHKANKGLQKIICQKMYWKVSPYPNSLLFRISLSLDYT